MLPVIYIALSNLMELLKSFIYNSMLTPFTKDLYRHFLLKVYEESHLDSNKNSKIRILDIGIGTGYALKRCLDEFNSNRESDIFNFLSRIEYVGVDINDNYLADCKKNLKYFDVLLFKVNLMKESERKRSLTDIISGTDTKKNIEEINRFDYVFFSNSFAVICPYHGYSRYNLVEYCLRKLCSAKGKVVICTTLENTVSKFRQFVKPRIGMITGVEFGYYTMAEDFIKDMIRSINTNRSIIADSDIIKDMAIIEERSFPIYGSIQTYICSIVLPDNFRDCKESDKKNN
jgi:SAM-dependent methyltransferase